jgi:hypothetical protein
MTGVARPESVEIKTRVRELGPWFHDLDLHGVRTAPAHPLGGFLRTCGPGGARIPRRHVGTDRARHRVQRGLLLAPAARGGARR